MDSAKDGRRVYRVDKEFAIGVFVNGELQRGLSPRYYKTFTGAQKALDRDEARLGSDMLRGLDRAGERTDSKLGLPLRRFEYLGVVYPEPSGRRYGGLPRLPRSRAQGFK